LSLCHLHNEITPSIHTQKILDAFDGSISLDIDNIEKIDDFKIYIVELQNINNKTSLKIKNLFEKKEKALIYFIIPKDYNIMLFQLAILVEVKYLITPNQDTEKVIKVIKSAISSKKEIKLDPNAIGHGSKSISDRLTFVEMLKNKLINKNTSNNNLSVITVGIQDEKRLLKNVGRDNLENFLAGLLSYMDLKLEKKLIFSQYDRDFYIAFYDDIKFEDIKKIAYDFYCDSIKYISEKEFKLLIDIFVFNLDGLEFSDILDKLDEIEHKTLNAEETSSFIQGVSDSDVEISAKHILEDAFKNKISFKLLNLYNGLCINTPSQIIKLKNESIYIKFEQLQGVMMNIDKNTIMQSSSFIKDIEADVKYIDVNKKIALLENFRFLETNANARKYARITPFGRMPISIMVAGSSVVGNVLDLSIKSIAVNAKYTQKIDAIRESNAKVIFNIANSSHEDGYTKLEMNARVIFSTMPDENNMCKIVCDFDINDDASEELLIEYVYDRQKELIVELKKMVKLS